MKKMIGLIAVLCSCGAAHAGTVMVTHYIAQQNAALFAYTYKTTPGSYFPPRLPTETVLHGENMIDSQSQMYNWIYAAELDGNLHVVGTAYPWKVKTTDENGQLLATGTGTAY